MKRTDVRQYQMLVRVREFGVAQASLFPQSTLAPEAFAAIDEAVKQLGKYTGEKVTSTRGSARAQARARAALLEALATVSRTARGIAAETPSFQNTFQIPSRRAVPALVTLARSFAQLAEPSAPLFIKRGLPDTFIADLNVLADTYDATIRARVISKQKSSEAQARIEVALNTGLSAVQQLDLVVANHFRADAGLQAAWAQARRVGYRKYEKEVDAPAAPLLPGSNVTPFTSATAPVESAEEAKDTEAA